MSEWTPVERFDPTWPWTFAFGYDRNGHRAHAWRLQDNSDGSLEHRMEFANHFGRTPSIRDGDQLGVANYIPEERKLDGTLVAPPEVQIHAYYDVDPNPEVTRWFEEKFPGAVVRRAHVFAKSSHVRVWAQTLPWTWTTDGDVLFGPKQFGPTSYTGTAEVRPDHVQIIADRETPHHGLADIKAELAKQYPTAEILLPPLPDEIFVGKPSLLDREQRAERRAAVLGWAQNLPTDDVEAELVAKTIEQQPAKLGFFNRFFRPKQAEADMEGAMIAVFIPEEIGKEIKVKGGESLDMLHVTLVYFTDKAADRDDWDEIEKIVETVANQTPKLSGRIGGFGVFNNDEDVLWASPSIPGLAELRQKLVEACEDAGFNVSDEHGWVPHITLKYDHSGKLPKLDKPLDLDIDKLTFARGNDKQDYDLQGHFEKTTMAADPQWVENWIAENGPYLYHGAGGGGRGFAGEPMNILHEGIRPIPRPDVRKPTREDYDWSETNPEDPWDWPLAYDGDMDEWWHTPRPNHVYMVTDPDKAYGTHLFQVDLRKLRHDNLAPDDDLLRDDGGMGDQDLYYKHPDYPTLGEQAESMGWGSNPEDTHRSFDYGVVAHRGVVPPEAVRLVATRPRGDYSGQHDWDWLKTSLWEQNEWSWPGTHRFVTDGKETLLEPEDKSEWNGADLDTLRDRFKSHFPDSEQTPAYGWAIPTADDMGYGVWAPTIGYGGEGELGIHKLISTLDKELKKPTHLVEDWGELTNPDLYASEPL